MKEVKHNLIFLGFEPNIFLSQILKLLFCLMDFKANKLNLKKNLKKQNLTTNLIRTIQKKLFKLSQKKLTQ
jgi:hypothetical protein